MLLCACVHGPPLPMQNSMGDPMVSTATPMHTIVNPSVVTIPHVHGMMSMGFHPMPECSPVPISTVSPHHSSPPPPGYSHSPPHQTPGSPHRAYGSPYHPGSPAGGMQQCMMEELGSPSLHHVAQGTMIETYIDRSPSRSPIQHHKFHPSQGLYTNSPQAIRI